MVIAATAAFWSMSIEPRTVRSTSRACGGILSVVNGASVRGGMDSPFGKERPEFLKVFPRGFPVVGVVEQRRGMVRDERGNAVHAPDLFAQSGPERGRAEQGVGGDFAHEQKDTRTDDGDLRRQNVSARVNFGRFGRPVVRRP